jgi:hypothetical protein
VLIRQTENWQQKKKEEYLGCIALPTSHSSATAWLHRIAFTQSGDYRRVEQHPTPNI